MVRLALLLFTLFSITAFADVNSDVNDCLNKSTGSDKAGCVQSAIDQEAQNQIQQLFNVYSNFVSNEINSGSFGAAQPGGSKPGSTPTATQPPPSQATPPATTKQPTKPATPGAIQYF